MPTFRQSLQLAGRAARENLLPGLVLQAFLLLFLLLYLFHDGTQAGLQRIAEIKKQSGYLFGFSSYVFAGALLPELLRIGLLQRMRPGIHNLRSFLTSSPLWGAIGLLVDALYRVQTALFGSGTDLLTIAVKVLVDQAIFSPFLCNPIIVGYFFWRDAGYSLRAWSRIFRVSFIWENLFPVQVAAWCIWIPGVTLVYFMPPLLQLPVAVLIQCFWVLVFTTVQLRSGKK